MSNYCYVFLGEGKYVSVATYENQVAFPMTIKETWLLHRCYTRLGSVEESMK